MNHRAAVEGVPLVVPLYHVWPRDEQAYVHPTQFAFGSQLLVAPITSPNDRRTATGSVRAWLPDGVWVDVLTDLVYDGGREAVLHRGLSGIPVLAPAGGLVPLDAREVPPDDAGNPEALEVLVIVGADGSFELVEDDGSGDGLDPATVARTPISFEQATGRVTVGPAGGALHAIPSQRSWTISFVAASGGGRPAATVDGTGVPASVHRTATRVAVTVADVPAGSVLVVDLGGPPPLVDNDVAGRLFALLEAAQIEFGVKTRIHAIATSDAPLHIRLSHLAALGLEPALATAVDEILLARA
jgi:hypothetical protein